MRPGDSVILGAVKIFIEALGEVRSVHSGSLRIGMEGDNLDSRETLHLHHELHQTRRNWSSVGGIQVEAATSTITF